jgi:fluoroacetyl-CoA thioesterase
MTNIFKTGDTKTFSRKVKAEDTASFDSGEVHPVYATFAVARDAEWVCRLFVLDMKEDDEEGIGTFITVKHISPALVGEEVKFDATILILDKNSIICSYHAYCGERLVAEGETGQKILKKERIERMFQEIKEGK